MTDKIWKFFTSLRLTVVLLALGLVLVFLGTLAQVHEGLWNAQVRWFKGFLVIREAGDPLWVPPIFPGGYLLGVLLLLNLAAAHIKRFHLTWNKLGINLTHFGVIMLLAGQLLTDRFAQESVMNFREGETKRFSEATRDFELVFTRPVDDQQEEVVAIPAELLKKGETVRNEKLPFGVKINEFWANSEPSFRAPMQQNGPALSDKGIAKDWDFRESKEARDMDSRNLPTAIIQLAGDNAAGDLGTWWASSWAGDEQVAERVRVSYAQSVGAEVANSIVSKLTAPQEVTVGDKTWRMALRPTRFYKGFSVTLLKTTHEVYPGTITSDSPQGIPKNFQSRVRIENPARDERREVDIYMNNPLRYEGLTFYQQTMGRDERMQVGQSGLQVVRNPSWQTPYWGCLIVAAGLVFQFGYHLIQFIAKRRKTVALA
jgi:hypothetical protein